MPHADSFAALLLPDGKLSAELADALNEVSSNQELKRGEFFISEGDRHDALGFVLKGCLRYYYLVDGEEITGEFWTEGELVGSYDTCILGQPSRLYIEALEDSTLLRFSYTSLKGLTEDFPKLNASMISILERFIVESQLRIASYITETPEARYLRLREEMPGIEDRVHQKYIASFIGVTPVTLSRIRARLSARS